MADWNVAGTTATLVFERAPRLDRPLVVADAVFAPSLTILAVELTLPKVMASRDATCSLSAGVLTKGAVLHQQLHRHRNLLASPPTPLLTSEALRRCPDVPGFSLLVEEGERDDPKAARSGSYRA
jgi:hypothetical protein